jgi:hypothetical protein
MCGTPSVLVMKNDVASVQEPDAAAHEGDGFELLDRRVHRVEAVRMEFKRRSI